MNLEFVNTVADVKKVSNMAADYKRSVPIARVFVNASGDVKRAVNAASEVRRKNKK